MFTLLRFVKTPDVVQFSKNALLYTTIFQKRLVSAAAVPPPPGPAAATHKKRDATPALAGTKLDPSESFMTGTNAIILEQMFEQYQADPSKVHPSWVKFFENINAEAPPGKAVSLSRQSRNKLSGMPKAMTSGRDLFQMAEDTIKLTAAIRAFRHRGHLIANIDPLNLDETLGSDHAASMAPKFVKQELDPSYYGFSEADLEREFVVHGELPGPSVRKLKDIFKLLRDAYCGNIGVEYRHMLSKEEKEWISSRIEAPYIIPLTKEEKTTILYSLAEAELFEKFLSFKHSTAKRFGLEGAEAVIPGLEEMVVRASELGGDYFIIGMPHRGRLNVLSHIVHKPLDQIFHEFTPHDDPHADSYLGSGDVKYHLGTTSLRKLRNGQTVNFSLMANPSHLEAVDPVVVGKTRAKQFFVGDTNRERIIPILLHGDASFAGQGVVAETMELSDLVDYEVGGTVHVVVNNQIGFTTDPRKARSSPYPTDVAKVVGVPIFHVNGDDVESVVRVFRLAIEYRQRYKKDVVVDLVCYRRHGHNELDQPMFTQPLMYTKIKSHPTPLTIYSKKLIDEGCITNEDVTAITNKIMDNFSEKFNISKDWKPKETDWLASQWSGLVTESSQGTQHPTGVANAKLKEIGSKIHELPSNFNFHPLIKKIFMERKTSVEVGEGIDWATAESLAFASLLNEDFAVRLSGQDCERGTFSQRHMVLHDQKVSRQYVPLNSLATSPQSTMQVCNSNLSEMAVLGFEVGFSHENPNLLVMWEAQFGDFADGAQVIFDTFISAGERKWRRQSGITVLLPHGYEGQGPEHSSARMERYLQMCDDDPDELPYESDVTEKNDPKQLQYCNWQIVNASTPANYFHVLRRQVHRDFRKPLILFTPKSLLRHPLCKSSMSEFDEGTRFRHVIDDPTPDLAEGKYVKKLVFCSGKVYYDLYKERAKRQINDIAFVRLEQISPFPYDRVAQNAAKYPNAELIWCQEESKNMGAWTYVEPRLRTALTKINNDTSRNTKYIGRAPSAAPATGNAKVHEEEYEEIMVKVFDF